MARIGTSTSTDVEEGLFQNCTGLGTVVLPSMTELPAETFRGCSRTKRISVPSVHSEDIGRGVFSDCINLKLLNLQSAIGAGNRDDVKVSMGIPAGCIVVCMDGEVEWGSHSRSDYEFPSNCY